MATLRIPPRKTPQERQEARAWESRLLKLEALVVKYSRDRKAAIEALGTHVNRQLSLAGNIKKLVSDYEALYDARGGDKTTP